MNFLDRNKVTVQNKNFILVELVVKIGSIIFLVKKMEVNPTQNGVGFTVYQWLVSIFSSPELIGKIVENIQLRSKHAIDIVSSPNIWKNVSILAALSYVGVIMGGWIGLTFAGVLGGLIALARIKQGDGKKPFFDLNFKALNKIFLFQSIHFTHLKKF